MLSVSSWKRVLQSLVDHLTLMEQQLPLHRDIDRSRMLRGDPWKDDGKMTGPMPAPLSPEISLK